MKLRVMLVIIALVAAAFGQTVVSSPQYTVNLSFLTGGPYQNSSALDVSFGTQFTTNNRLQADFITMPTVAPISTSDATTICAPFGEKVLAGLM